MRVVEENIVGIKKNNYLRKVEIVRFDYEMHEIQEMLMKRLK